MNLTGNRLDEAIKLVHSAFVHRIPEFDRIEKEQIPTLKYLITASATDVRLPYDPRPEKRYLRASYIGSYNQKNILSDHTGNRRFWILEAKYLGFNIESASVERNYPGLFCRPNFKQEQLQIISQFKHLAEIDYKPEKEVLQKMRTFVSEQTPDDPELPIVESIDALVTKYQASGLINSTCMSKFSACRVYKHTELQVVFEEVRKSFHIPNQTLLHILGNFGRRETIKIDGKQTKLYRVGNGA